MLTRPFQTKETKIICLDEKLVIHCYSMTHADLVLKCARMANNPKYTPPVMGWGEEDLQVAKALKGRKIRIERYSFMNYIYIERRKQ